MRKYKQQINKTQRFGNHYPPSLNNTFNASKWGLVGQHAFHAYCPTFLALVDPLSALPTGQKHTRVSQFQ